MEGLFAQLLAGAMAVSVWKLYRAIAKHRSEDTTRSDRLWACVWYVVKPHLGIPVGGLLTVAIGQGYDRLPDGFIGTALPILAMLLSIAASIATLLMLRIMMRNERARYDKKAS